MIADAGVIRDAASLDAAFGFLETAAATHPPGPVRDAAAAGLLIVTSALARRESRGGHYRADFPLTDPAWARRSFLSPTPADAAGRPPLPAAGQVAMAAAG